MAIEEKKRDYAASRMVLDMKALALLHPSDADLQATVAAGILGAHDDQVARVIESLRAGKEARKSNSFAVAIGELILASFLLITGLVAISPFLVGVNNPSGIVQYFSSSIGSFATSPSFFPFLPELVVVLSVSMLMSALYALRQASTTLKEEGFSKR
jgi:hypothetical protein